MNQRDTHRRSREHLQAPSRPDQVRERLREAVIARMLPLLGELQGALEAELRRAQPHDEAGSPQISDDLTSLSILRRHAMLYEGRWKAYLAGIFNAWPQAPTSETDLYALVSDGELQSQLVGQPIIEALDRRFADILDVLDSRLWDFALRASGQGEAVSPIAPRVFVEGLLSVYPASECSPSLRQGLLRHYQTLAGDQLGDFYAWFNTELAEAGFAMSRPGRYAIQVAAPTDGFINPAFDAGGTASPRAARRSRGVTGEASELGEALRQRVRLQRTRGDTNALISPGRTLDDHEFLAVLSLVQAEPAAETPAPVEGLGRHLRDALISGAGKLGLDPASTALSLQQDDAIDLVGSLFDGLVDQHDFHIEASRSFTQMAFPYVHLVLRDPDLFDDSEDPAMRLLAELTVLWDGAAPGGGLYAAGARACRAVVEEYHGDARVFERTLDALRAEVEPLRLRSEIAARRAWEAMAGRERLEAARRIADAQLHDLLGGRSLLPTVADFLCDVWRQALVHAWLREGAQSTRYCKVLAMGEAVVQVDAAGAAGAGHVVAEHLLQLETALRACHVACGLDESAANNLIAMLVAEVARPDATRRVHTAEPLHGGSDVDMPAPGAVAALKIGQMFIYHTEDATPEALRLIGISELSGRHLMAGTRSGQVMFEAEEVVRSLRDGRLVPRSSQDPVEAVMKRLVEN